MMPCSLRNPTKLLLRCVGYLVLLAGDHVFTSQESGILSISNFKTRIIAVSTGTYLKDSHFFEAGIVIYIADLSTYEADGYAEVSMRVLYISLRL
jgi:hypothetical protein